MRFKIDLKGAAAKIKRLGLPLTETGAEIPDSKPMAPPLGYVPRESLFDRVREMVRSENMALLAERDGKESFTEANDFGPDDDGLDMPTTIYEKMGAPENFVPTMQRSKAEQARVARAEDRFAKKIAKAVKNPEFEEETPIPRKSPTKSAGEAPESLSDPADK